MKLNYRALIISIIIPFIAAGIGSYFTSSAISTWYAILAKPYFNPPNYLFGPVWTVLYALMGVSLYLVWNSRKKLVKRTTYIIFGLQLGMNTLWSIVFFGMKNPETALTVIIALWILIAMNIYIFYKINKIAGLIMIPYLLWVSFASVLNYYIVILN